VTAAPSDLVRRGGDGGPRVANARRIAIGAMLSIVLGQRFGIPIGGDEPFPLSLLAVLFLVAWGVAGGVLQLNFVRYRLYVIACSVLLALTLLAFVADRQPSLPSALLAVALYALATFDLSLRRADIDRVYDVFIHVMTVAAIVSLLQGSVQYVGVEYQDWVGDLLPQALVIPNYNSGDPLAYGSTIYRVNGLLFLEPSFLSYFLGIAVVVALQRRAPWWKVAVLLAGMVPTLAGNGFVIVLPAIVLLFALADRGIRRLAIPLALAAVLALITPVGSRLVDRVDEIGSPGSSGYLRMVAPYTVIIPPVLEDPVAMVVGFGAGRASDYASDFGPDALIVPYVPKLLFEYGLVGTAAFSLFALSVFLTGVRRPLVPGLLLAYFVVNAAFLQAPIALTTILFIVTLRPTKQLSAVPPSPGVDDSLVPGRRTVVG
jgi:hypothetical protein